MAYHAAILPNLANTTSLENDLSLIKESFIFSFPVTSVSKNVVKYRENKY